MEPITIALIVLCAIMLAIIIWLICRSWKSMSQETKDGLVEKGMQLLTYLKNAWQNDGKIDTAELEQIMKYLVSIIAYLAGRSEYSVKVQSDTYELLEMQDKTE